MSASDNVIRYDAMRLLVERRIEIYGRVAALLMDIEGGITTDDWDRTRYHLVELRRILRTSLAFLTDEVYEELENIEALCHLGAGVENTRKPNDIDVLQEHLQLLHIKFSKALREPTFQDLESIVGADVKLKRKLKASRRQLAAKVKSREAEESAWELEAQARAFIESNEPKKALKALNQAIDLAPTLAVFHNDLGFVQGQLGDLHKSAEAYKKAIELNEAHPEQRSDEWTTSYYNLGVANRKLASHYFKKQQEEISLAFTTEALDSFETYLEVSPSGSKAAMTREALVDLLEVHDILKARLAPPSDQEQGAA